MSVAQMEDYFKNTQYHFLEFVLFLLVLKWNL